MKKIFSFLVIIFCFCQAALAQPNIVYDVVLEGGRVIDPETKLDAEWKNSKQYFSGAGGVWEV